MEKTLNFRYFASKDEILAIIGSFMISNSENLSFYNDSGQEIEAFEESKLVPPDRVIWVRIKSSRSENKLDNFINFVQFILPKESAKALLMGSVAIKCDEFGSENHRLFHKLVNMIKKNLKNGLYAVNKINGKSRNYGDIYYSDYAEYLSKSGGILLSVYGDGNVYYKI